MLQNAAKKSLCGGAKQSLDEMYLIPLFHVISLQLRELIKQILEILEMYISFQMNYN